MKKASKIGVFDSGIGGLTVAKAIVETGLYNEMIYFGDIAHLPYGDKSEAAIQSYAIKISRFLVENGCDSIAIACNSASASATNLVKEYFVHNTPVINVIDPMVDHVLKNYPGKKVGLIGTKRTIDSGIYEKKILEEDPSIQVYSHATPLLVPLIEEDKFSDHLKNEIIREYLHGEKLVSLDALILGCTHYPLLKNELENYFGNGVDILESSTIVADKLLSEHVRNEPKTTECRFFVSDYTPAFERSARKFFGREINLERSKLFDSF